MREARMPFLLRGTRPAQDSIHPVDALSQLLAGLEMRNELVRNLHRGSGLRVAAGARRAVMQAEAAEAADLNALAGRERRRHLLQQLLHREFHVPVLQLRLLGRQRRDQLGFRHLSNPIENKLTNFKAVRTPMAIRAPRPNARQPSESSWVPSFSLSLSPSEEVAPPTLRVYSCTASVSSCTAFARTDREILRFLRSMAVIFASTSSPSLSTERASSTRSRAISEARRYPSISSASLTTAPLASTLVTVPLTMVPLPCAATKEVNGSPSSCFTPSEMRSRSGSTARMTASISSPFL